MRNKYRKMYNENLLGTSELSIVKFYYASFKLQQLSGKIENVTEYLQYCVKTSKHISILLKIYGIFPFINIWLGTGKEQKKVAKVLEEKQKAVEYLFLKDDISNEDIQLLLSDITFIPIINRISQDEAIMLSIRHIKSLYQISKKKQRGDRIFGYLIKSNTLIANCPKERIELWNKTFPNVKPSNPDLFLKPEKNRSDFPYKIIEDLKYIADFFHQIQLYEIEKIVLNDLHFYEKNQ